MNQEVGVKLNEDQMRFCKERKFPAGDDPELSGGQGFPILVSWGADVTNPLL